MLAVVALLVLGTLAEAASVKYGYPTRGIYKLDSYEPSHESYYTDQHYDHKPSYESHYENQDYSHRPHHDSYDEDHYGRDVYSVEPSYTPSMKSSPAYKQTHEPRYRYDHKPSYNSHKYKRSVYGYGGDSYGKSYNSYGGDSYGKSYSYRHKKYSKSHEPRSYRQKRSMEREEQICCGPWIILRFQGGEVEDANKRSKEEREKQISLFQGSDSFSLSFRPNKQSKEEREEQIIGGWHPVTLSFPGGEVEGTIKRFNVEREEQISFWQGDDSFSLSFQGSGQVEDANRGRSEEMSAEV